jgi:hypothetical protein
MTITRVGQSAAFGQQRLWPHELVAAKIERQHRAPGTSAEISCHACTLSRLSEPTTSVARPAPREQRAALRDPVPASIQSSVFGKPG